MKRVWLRPLVWWAYSAIAVTGVCALVHVAVQQSLRQGANDPQIQMAEDIAYGTARNPDEYPNVSLASVDVEKSLAPWWVVYDAQGVPIGSSYNALLHNEPVTLPQGVFNTSDWKSVVGHHLTIFYPANENRFTWQPEPGVRHAVVLVHAPDGTFVAAGRSLREVESRESQLTFETFILWAFTLACLFVASFIMSWVLGR